MSMFRQARLACVLAVLAGFLLHVVSAEAAFDSRHNASQASTTSPEITMTGVGPGQAVTGFVADASNPFDPVVDGYPASNPTEGFTRKDEDFAGIIHGTPAGGGAQLDLYCIDIFTETSPGDGYALGTWDAANVPNVGYIARVLQEYYPNTEQPASLTALGEKAAAVQAAIWFFSSRYVLSTSDPVYAATVAIVDQVIAQGPLTQPPPSSLTLTPSKLSGPSNGVLGPFTVSTGSGQATVTATGANMFSDAAGTVPIADGATVPSGQEIWLRSTAGPAVAALQATATATVPTGNVYLYTGNAGGTEAQSLILAEEAAVPTTVQATAEFLEPNFSIEKLQQIRGSGGEFTTSELTAKLGEVVSYEIVVANTGNTPLKFSPLSDQNCVNILPAGASELAVGGTETFTCEHSITRVGTWTNEAEIEAAGKLKPSNKVVVKTPEEPNYEVEKLQLIKGSAASFTKADLSGKIGEVVDYEVIVRNTGNVAIMFAPLIDTGCSSISPSGATEVPVGGSEVFTCEHTLASSGSWTNQATIEGAGKTKPSNAVLVNVAVPAQITKAQCAISESVIVLHGVSGSKRKTFAVRIPALGIKEITFYLDGRKVKTLKASQASNGEFKVNINPGKLSYGAHRVSVKTVMTDNACAAIARSAVFVHTKRALVKPRFTG